MDSSPALPIYVHLDRGRNQLTFASVQSSFNHAANHLSDVSPVLERRITEAGEIRVFVFTAHIGAQRIKVEGRATLMQSPDGKKQLKFELGAVRAEDEAFCRSSCYPRIMLLR